MILSVLLRVTFPVWLVGCNSFNHYALPDDTNRLMVARQLQAKQLNQNNKIEADLETPVSLTPVCPLYRRPILPKVPELPFEELKRISPTDQLAVEQIRDKHISDLRKYISEVRKIEQEAYRHYLEDCKLLPPNS